MHGHITKPGKKHNMPKGEFTLAFQRNPCPDGTLGHWPKITDRSNAELGKYCDCCRYKYHDHPGGRDVGKPAHVFKSKHGHYGGDCPNYKNGKHPVPTGRVNIIEGRHGHIKGDAHCGGRYCDHGACEKAKQSGIDEVVDEGELIPRNFLKLIIKCKPFSSGYFPR